MIVAKLSCGTGVIPRSDRPERTSRWRSHYGGQGRELLGEVDAGFASQFVSLLGPSQFSAMATPAKNIEWRPIGHCVLLRWELHFYLSNRE